MTFKPTPAPEITRTTTDEVLVSCERYGQFAIAQTQVRHLKRYGTVGGDWLLGTIIEQRTVSHITDDDGSLPIVQVSQVLDWERSWGSTAKHVAVAAALASMTAGKIVSG